MNKKKSAHYELYIGPDAGTKYRIKMGMDESIFPDTVADINMVDGYKMVYFDPWDAQWLSYIVIDYDNDSYNAEIDRLKSYQSTEYLGYFNVTGFRDKYTLLAMEANPDAGFVYALTDGSNKIVYVEIIFCNIALDLIPSLYIPGEYLPNGFNASFYTKYRRERLNASISEEFLWYLSIC